MGIETREATSARDRLTAAQLGQIGFAREGSVPLVEQARRLKSTRRARATTWLLLEDGECASVLLANSLTLRRGDESRPAFGLGSVVTHPSFRGRGHASRLCSEIAVRHGGVGLLYSAIDASFYERLGYAALPAWDFRCGEVAALAGSGTPAPLVPLDPRREVARLDSAWRAAHGGWYLERDWATTLIDNPDDIWFAVGESGYMRILIDEDGLDIGECCTDDHDGAIRAGAALALGVGAHQVTGWLDPTPFVTRHFVDAGRDSTRPMLLGLDAPETARLSSADYF